MKLTFVHIRDGAVQMEETLGLMTTSIVTTEGIGNILKRSKIESKNMM